MSKVIPEFLKEDVYIESTPEESHVFKSVDTDANLVILLRIDDSLDTKEAVGYVVLVENLFPSVYAVFLGTSVRQQYDDPAFESLFEIIADSFKVEPSICLWTHFRSLVASRDTFGDFMVQSIRPGNKFDEILIEVDTLDEVVFSFNLLHAKFSAVDGNWIAADSVAMGIFKILKDQGEIEDFFPGFSSKLKFHIETYLPQVCSLFPEYFHVE